MRNRTQATDLENESLADPPGGVIGGVSLLTQIPGAHQGDGDGIPENHLDRGRGDGGEVERAQLPLQRQIHVHVATALQQVLLGGRDGDQERAFRAGAGHQPQELLGVARFAEEDEDVAVGEDADVAVEGVDGGQEAGADAEGDEGLGDLVGDEAGLADAGEEDGAAGAGFEEEGLGEAEGLGEVEVVEEEVEVALLGLEEAEEGGLVDGGGGGGVLGLIWGGGRRAVHGGERRERPHSLLPFFFFFFFFGRAGER